MSGSKRPSTVTIGMPALDGRRSGAARPTRRTGRGGRWRRRRASRPRRARRPRAGRGTRAACPSCRSMPTAPVGVDDPERRAVAVGELADLVDLELAGEIARDLTVTEPTGECRLRALRGRIIGRSPTVTTGSGTASPTCTPSQGREVVIRDGGGRLADRTNGRRYLDATAALWYCNVGYGRGEIADAVARAAGPAAGLLVVRRLHVGAHGRDSPSAWPTLAPDRRTPSSSSARAARTRSTRRPSSSAATGTSSGKPEKRIIVSRELGYHGMHALGHVARRDRRR